MSGYLLKFKQTYSVKIGGRRYPVVKIGNQLWMAENLDYSDPNITETSSMTSSYATMYHNENLNYGAYYNQRAVEYLTTNEQSLFPSAWRVAKKADYLYLLSLGYNISDFLSTSAGGTNANGFNAYLSGQNGDYGFEEVGVGFSSWVGSTSSTDRGVFYINPQLSQLNVYDGWYEPVQRSIRLVKSLT